MASQDGKGKNAGKKPGKLKYFFLNKELHRTLHINRGTDTIITWCYPQAKRVTYTYSDTRKRRDPAFTTTEVGKMLNRKTLAIERAILGGGITPPQFTYGLNEHRNKHKYMWHETNIMEAHEYFSNTHYGRPRNDGLITPYPIPTAREVRAMIRQETVLYVVNDSGQFVPVWKNNFG